MPPKLSVCLIVKNEEAVLGRCLKSVQAIADQIVLVDTGSTDKTTEVARTFGAQIHHFPWSNDFSAARNAALDQTKGEWVLQLDADEELEAADVPRLRELLDDPVRLGYLLSIVNLQGETADTSVPWSFPSLRLFRNSPKNRYEGIVHEQIQIPGANGETIGFADVRILHYGYLRPHLDAKNKGKRNMELISMALEKDPDNHFNLYILGNEYFAAGRYGEALDAYGKAYAFIEPPLPLFFPKLLRNIVSCLRELGRWRESIEAADIAQRDFPDYTDLEFLKGLNYLEHNEPEAAVASFSTCLEKGEAPPVYDTQPGVGGWRAMVGLGIAYSQKSDDDSAASYLKQALGINPRDQLAAKHLGAILLKTVPAPEARRRLEHLVDVDTKEMQETIKELFG